jgi:Protein of unknown function (DUF2934)
LADRQSSGVKEWNMLEKDTARSAEAKPKGKAEAAPRVRKRIATTSAARTAAGKPAALTARNDEMHGRIQRRAYELWESEGRPAGREHAHWLQAEREIARARSQRIGRSQ